MKKFVNDPRDFVPEMLKGIALANPDTIRYVPEYNLIMRADMPRDDKVSIIQGSGSGHEPAHVMAVGRGMLDAACPGDVFAAPPMDYVLETSKLMNTPKGVLHIINNYTGDRMAFDMGREMAEAEGVTIGTVIVDDDVAVKDSTYTVGRRGVAGNFFVIKALGAASEQGAELDELVELGQRVNAVARTMGCSTGSVNCARRPGAAPASLPRIRGSTVACGSRQRNSTATPSRRSSPAPTRGPGRTCARSSRTARRAEASRRSPTRRVAACAWRRATSTRSASTSS